MELGIPCRFKEKYLKNKLIWQDNKLFQFIITVNFQLIECDNKLIINYVSLKSFDTENTLIAENIRICELDVVRTSSGAIFCLVQINSTVFIIKKSGNQFKLHYYDRNINDYRLCAGRDNAEENLVLFITFMNGKILKSRFNEVFCAESVIHDKNNEIEKYLYKKRNKLYRSIEEIQKQRLLKYNNLIQKQKFVATYSRIKCEDTEEIQPLVRFGNIFERICNDKLITGIPLLNLSQG